LLAFGTRHLRWVASSDQALEAMPRNVAMKRQRGCRAIGYADTMAGVCFVCGAIFGKCLNPMNAEALTWPPESICLRPRSLNVKMVAAIFTLAHAALTTMHRAFVYSTRAIRLIRWAAAD